MTNLAIEELLKWQAYKATIQDIQSRIGILNEIYEGLSAMDLDVRI